MNDIVLLTVVIAGALVVVFGTAYAMDQRRKAKMKAETKVLPGPVSRIIVWISYGVLVITVLFIIGAFAFNQIGFANLAWNFIFLYIIVGIIYRIVRPRGM